MTDPVPVYEVTETEVTTEVTDPVASDPTTRALIETLDRKRRVSPMNKYLEDDALDAWHAAHEPQPRTETILLRATLPPDCPPLADFNWNWILPGGVEITVEVVDP